MRRLMLLRHAKALPAKGGKDIDRPLTEEGREEAQVVGQYMAAEGLETTLALISPAERTRQTFDLVDNFLMNSPKMRVEPAMFEASWVSLFELVRKTPVKQTFTSVSGPQSRIRRSGERIDWVGKQNRSFPISSADGNWRPRRHRLRYKRLEPDQGTRRPSLLFRVARRFVCVGKIKKPRKHRLRGSTLRI